MLFFSMRRDGKSLGQMVREEIGVVGGIAALIAVFAIMIIILAVLALVVVNALAESPWGVFSIGLTIPIALFMGFYLRHLRPGRVAEVTAIGVGLLLLAIIGGGYVEEMGLADALTLSKEQLTLGLVIYGFVASILPVWMLLTPRDYLSTFMKVGVIVLLAVGLMLAAPVLQNEAVTDFAHRGHRPGLRRQALPVRLHHDRLRRAVGLPRPDRLGHDPEDGGQGEPRPDDRVRRHADGVLRRHQRADRGLRHRPGPLLRDERARRRHRRRSGDGRRVRPHARLHDHPGRPQPPPPSRSRSRR